MARLDDWENIIAVEVNGAPLPTMMDAVRDAAIEFCQRTRIDTRLVEGLPYDLTQRVIEVPDGDPEATPFEVMNLWTEHGRIAPSGRRDLESTYPDGWAFKTASCVRDIASWYSPQPGIVRLVPRPTVDVTVTLDVAYQPKRNGWQIIDFLYELYAKEIGYGAIAALHLHSNAPYADPSRSSAYRQFFDQRIAQLSDIGVAGHQKPRLRVARSEWA